MKHQKSDHKRAPHSDEKNTVSLLHDWGNVLNNSVSFQERVAQGKQMRSECPRSTHGLWNLPKHRENPLELLASQDENRTDHLVPLRYGRMMKSPFAFYRGSALVMASDLSHSPRTKLAVQLCGDCHLSNFGIFATPERNIIFDLNDFDETLPGAFEWDLKRLAASFVVAAEDNGFTENVASRCVMSLARVYRTKMEEFSRMNSLDIWYQRVDWEYLVTRIKQRGRRQTEIENLAKLKSNKSHAGAISKLTEVVDGKRRIKDNPPLVFHVDHVSSEAIKSTLHSYATSLLQSRQRLLQRYNFVDLAAKVVGVGSVGTAAGIILLQGEGSEDDQIFLQLKEANRSVLENYIGNSQFDHCGQRIVNGQRLLQSASDVFLGWTSGPERQFYVRQLMDVKASVPIDELDAVSLEQYATVCAFVLARAHARTGDPAAIHGYLGKSESFDESLTRFALAYAKQNESDYAALLDAIDKGKIPVETPQN